MYVTKHTSTSVTAIRNESVTLVEEIKNNINRLNLSRSSQGQDLELNEKVLEILETPQDEHGGVSYLSEVAKYSIGGNSIDAIRQFLLEPIRSKTITRSCTICKGNKAQVGKYGDLLIVTRPCAVDIGYSPFFAPYRQKNNQ
ncbi:unnamed protein product [Rhizophagus irregularis]|nr:unnamed protein product [Rhizophagus irregularis]